MKTIYRYMVAYTYEEGMGSFYYTVNRKINSLKEIRRLTEYIESKNSFKNVVPFNIQLLHKRKTSERRFV